MQPFAPIHERAAARKGGVDALEALLADAEPRHEKLAAMGDDRILAEFSKRVFQAGFNWHVVEDKWPGFEAAFHGFDVARNAMMSDEDVDAHLRDARIVRNAAKILSVRDNAVFLSDLARERGAAARAIAEWPVEDHAGLLALLAARGSRLGGMSGQYALRFLGRDSYVLSPSVTAALIEAGVIGRPATSKKAMAGVQAAFNAWREETGWGLTRLSRILAFSTDA